MERKKTIIKIVIIVILFSVVMSLYVGKSSENKSYANSYGDTNSNFDKSKIRMSYLQNFMELLMYQNYEDSYNMLTDECKEEVFENNFEFFKEYVTCRWFNTSDKEKKVYYENTEKVENEEGEKVYIYKVLISVKDSKDYIITDDTTYEEAMYIYDHNIRATVYEQSLYDYKIKLEILDE